MELHVLKQAGNKATPQALVRSIKRADAIVARLAADETYLDGATAYTSPRYPTVARANCAMDIRLPDGAGAASVLEAIDAHFSQAGVSCLEYDSSELVWPSDFGRLLCERGGRPLTRQVLELLRYQALEPSPQVQVIPGRAAYGEAQKLHHARARTVGMDEAAAKEHAAAMVDQLDDSRIDLFLARKQRVSLGAASLLTLGNVGVILDWFVLDEDADEPVWRTLAARVIDHCQRAQFEQVIVRFDSQDMRIARFEAMGFAQAASYESYVRSR